MDLVSRFSNPDVLRFLAQQGRRGATTPEVCTHFGLDKTHARRLLAALEVGGLVRSERVAGSGTSKGSPTRWFIRRTVVAKTLEDLRAYILGSKD